MKMVEIACLMMLVPGASLQQFFIHAVASWSYSEKIPMETKKKEKKPVDGTKIIDAFKVNTKISRYNFFKSSTIRYWLDITNT